MKHFILFVSFFLTIVSAWKNDTKQFDLRIFNLNELLEQIPISEECRSVISDQERICFGHHLMRFEGFEVKDSSDRSVIYSGDSSSEFDRRVCCEIWRWFDCTGTAITSSRASSQSCTKDDYSSWWKWPEEDNQITYYCTTYEYGTYYCWYISLWLAILLAITIFALISAVIIYCICNYKSSRITSQSHSRNDITPRKLRKEVRYNFPL